MTNKEHIISILDHLGTLYEKDEDATQMVSDVVNIAAFLCVSGGVGLEDAQSAFRLYYTIGLLADVQL